MDFYHMSNYGESTDPRGPNQLAELNQKLSTGEGAPMVTVLDRGVWEVIPKHHFQEMYRLSNLTKTQPNIHAPVNIELTGFSEKGGFSEETQKQELNVAKDVIYKAHMMAPNRNVPVVFHGTSMLPGAKWVKDLYSETDPKTGKEKKMEKAIDMGVKVDTGEIIPLKFDKQYSPPGPKEQKEGKEFALTYFTPEKQIRTHNATTFRDEINKLHDFEWRIDELQRRMSEIGGKYQGESANVQIQSLRRHEELLAEKVQLQVDGIYNRFKEMPPENKEAKKLFEAVMEKAKEENDKFNTKLYQLSQKAKSAKTDAEQKMIEFMFNQAQREQGQVWSNAFEYLQQESVFPQQIAPLEDFARKKAADSFGALGVYSIETAKGDVSKAPVIVIENTPANHQLFSRGEELKKLIDDSRKSMVQKLVEKKGFSEADANAAAKKVIGATWDVGHINFLRQGGFTEEDIVNEVKPVAKDVKFVHLTDNFGTTDAHLAPGMGNVPIQGMMKEIEKAGSKPVVVIEAGNLVAHHKESIWPHVLSELNSPIYEFSASPSWGEKIGEYFFKSSYGPGFGDILPSYHFQTYGAGYSGLPLSLGAPTPGEKSKFSETPMS